MMETIVEGDEGEADFRATLIRSGVPAERLAELQPHWTGELYDYPAGWLRDGDLPKAGDRELRAVATPRAHQGTPVLRRRGRRSAVRRRPRAAAHHQALGFAVIDGHEPLADYLDSLRRVRQRPDAMLLPAHGPVGPSVHARADELLAHHEIRLRQCADADRRGRAHRLRSGAARPVDQARAGARRAVADRPVHGGARDPRPPGAARDAPASSPSPSATSPTSTRRPDGRDHVRRGDRRLRCRSRHGRADHAVRRRPSRSRSGTSQAPAARLRTSGHPSLGC